MTEPPLPDPVRAAATAAAAMPARRAVTATTALTALVLAAAAATATPAARAATPAELLAGFGGSPSAARGQQFFTTAHGREWNCATCHGATPIQAGRHASTGKPIAALAPAANAERFTDPAKVEKWFRRNCNDVVGRECTVAEKADVLAWLMTLKP